MVGLSIKSFYNVGWLVEVGPYALQVVHSKLLSVTLLVCPGAGDSVHSVLRLLGYQVNQLVGYHNLWAKDITRDARNRLSYFRVIFGLATYFSDSTVLSLNYHHHNNSPKTT